MNRRNKKSNWQVVLRRWSKRRLENSENELSQRQRANWCELVPEIAFVLLKCRATRERAHIHDIAVEALATYRGSFDTYFDGRRIPDHSLIFLALAEAKKREWGYVAGNWFKGWRLTKKGAAFARDVQRRWQSRHQQRIAA